MAHVLHLGGWGGRGEEGRMHGAKLVLQQDGVAWHMCCTSVELGGCRAAGVQAQAPHTMNEAPHAMNKAERGAACHLLGTVCHGRDAACVHVLLMHREAKEKSREGWYMAYIMDTNEEERSKVRAPTYPRLTIHAHVHAYTRTHARQTQLPRLPCAARHMGAKECVMKASLIKARGCKRVRDESVPYKGTWVQKSA